MTKAKDTTSTKDTTVVSTEDIPTVAAAEDQQVAVRPADALAAEVAPARLYEEDELRGIDDFDAAMRLAAEMNDGIVDASKEIGDGFALLKDEDKRRLVGVPLLIMEWSFYDGDFGSRFVAVRIVTRNPDGGSSKYIINDGSTGICDTLARYQDQTGRVGGVLCRNGLRASDYTYCEECGHVVNPRVDSGHIKHHKVATTYYIDSSA